MRENRLKLYFISDDYINYLRKFDDKVRYNKKARRPYIGIVYTSHGKNYFAPLASPKPKHLKMNKKAIDIWKIDDGKLGIINFNNMVPCPIEVLTEAIPIVTDEKYKILLQNQISSINSDRKELIKKIRIFRGQYDGKRLSKNIMDRCCNFYLLEKKCDEYLKTI